MLHQAGEQVESYVLCAEPAPALQDGNQPGAQHPQDDELQAQQLHLDEPLPGGRKEMLSHQNPGAALPKQELKVAWGTMWTVEAVECPGGTTEYSSFERGDLQEGHQIAVDRAHTVPTMLRVLPGIPSFQYAVL